MLIGYNNDVQHRGKTFHVQTEDRGMQSKQIETQIFCSGAILDTRIVSYADLIEGVSSIDERNKAIKTLMQNTHRELYKRMVAGEYDHFVGLEPIGDKPATEALDEAAEDFNPGQDRVPAAALEVEQGGEFEMPEGADEHVDLSKLKDQLGELGDDESEDDQPTQITSIDGLPELLQLRKANKPAKSQKAAVMLPPKPRVGSSRDGSPDDITFPEKGVEAWQGCHPMTSDLSIVELVEAHLSKG
jgi:hypothetical protein